MSKFTDFALGIGKGLATAYTEDVDVFVLITAGILSNAPLWPLRGLGKALVVYSAYRRADEYVTAMTTTANRIAFAPQGIMTDE